MENNKFCGVDFGAKLAGTTAIAFADSEGKICVEFSKKGQDADTWLLGKIQSAQFANVFIDAPLSLPGIYRALPNCSDYFYRKCDRDLQAMSPMFLGGLTARAMRLQKQLHDLQIECKETYPAYIATQLGLKELGYKKDKAALNICLETVEKNYNFKTKGIENWHCFDALLAYIGGIHFQSGKGKKFGDAEGIVYV
jgi:predicted nuclease with RNAse H fold